VRPVRPVRLTHRKRNKSFAAEGASGCKLFFFADIVYHQGISAPPLD